MPLVGSIKYMRSIYGLGGMEEKHDEWYTTKELYDWLCERFNIQPEYDIAAHDGSHMCDEYLTKEDNALKKSWFSPQCDINDIAPKHLKPKDIYMNPPLLGGLTKKFVLKAEEQWMKYNMNILSIVPAGVISRQWFRHLWWKFRRDQGVEIEPIDRPTFSERGQPLGQQARNDYIALIFRQR
jgi:hypothetical protein